MNGMWTWERLRRPLLVGIGALALALGVFKVPLASILFLVVVLLCPLMMLGIHGGGHDHSGHTDSGREAKAVGPSTSKAVDRKVGSREEAER